MNILQQNTAYLHSFDPEVASMIEREYDRQNQNIELIASENIASAAVIAAMGSVLTNKYAEGYPGKRYYGGCVYADELEALAIERAKALFGAEFANVQPHRPIWRSTPPCSSRAIRSWAWILPTAAT